jgi:hypothetical protein
MTGATLTDFPFPLLRDSYQYTTNLQPAAERVTNAGAGYEDFIAERSAVLAYDPGMLITAPHMRAAEWDTLAFMMRRLAAEYPGSFELDENGARMRWANRRLSVSQEFTFGDAETLPCGPLEFIGRQVVEDLVLLDEREGHLHADAGLVTFASGWSFPFVAGMSFTEIHGPVPRANPDGVFTRAEAFLTRLQPGEAYRRVNWTFQPGRVLDKSMDSHARWMPAAAQFLADVAAGNVGDAEFGSTVNLRVEVQHLVRLETSGAVLFLIDTRFLTLAELARVAEWARRTAAVLESLPGDIADYKGLAELGPRIAAWLRRHPTR